MTLIRQKYVCLVFMILHVAQSSRSHEDQAYGSQWNFRSAIHWNVTKLYDMASSPSASTTTTLAINQVKLSLGVSDLSSLVPTAIVTLGRPILNVRLVSMDDGYRFAALFGS